MPALEDKVLMSNFCFVLFLFVYYLAFTIWALNNESCFNELIVSALEDQFHEVSLFSKGEMLFLICHTRWRDVTGSPQYFMVETLDVHRYERMFR